jgi:hypothetical protein
MSDAVPELRALVINLLRELGDLAEAGVTLDAGHWYSAFFEIGDRLFSPDAGESAP